MAGPGNDFINGTLFSYKKDGIFLNQACKNSLISGLWNLSTLMLQYSINVKQYGFQSGLNIFKQMN